MNLRCTCFSSWVVGITAVHHHTLPITYIHISRYMYVRLTLLNLAEAWGLSITSSSLSSSLLPVPFVHFHISSCSFFRSPLLLPSSFWLGGFVISHLSFHSFHSTWVVHPPPRFISNSLPMKSPKSLSICQISLLNYRLIMTCQTPLTGCPTWTPD